MEIKLNLAKLGGRVRRAREASLLTQAELGECCNLSTAQIGHIERGKRAPSIETLHKISIILDVSADYLLMDASPKNPSMTAIAATIVGKDPRKVKTFITVVKALADKIDEL